MTTDLSIGFDADDTLWHNENIFEKVHEKYFKLLSKYHDAATVEQALFATEMRNLQLYGYGIKGYMLSSIETAITLTGGSVEAGEIQEILTLGKEMLNHPVELLPGSTEALDKLVRSYRLILITKGDLRDQERKLAKSGFADRFQAVEIVSDGPCQPKRIETLAAPALAIIMGTRRGETRRAPRSL